VKKYIEMRGADCGDVAHLAALPAIWVGLMYDQGALDAAWDLVKGFDAQTREGLRVAASVAALHGGAGGVTLLELSRQAVALAQSGLRARARAGAGRADEAGYLDVLAESVERGQVQADRLLALYHGAWGGRLEPVYEAASY
jgi:glutamate--cysteine ligase